MIVFNPLKVHLLCMPVGRDNICEKSSQYHFVNDYLYKTVDNEDGSSSDSGIYADRYYPEGFELGQEFDEVETDKQHKPNFQSVKQKQQFDRPDQRQRRPVHQQQNRDRISNNPNRRVI